MLRSLVLVAAILVLGIAFAPRFEHVAAWVLAFLILLLLGDLIRSAAGRSIGRR
jgi:hypothetical protein